MAGEELISINEYMRRYKVGYVAVKQAIEHGQLELVGKKIKVGGNTVSKEIYEEEHKKRIEAETTLELLKKVLIERS